MSQTDLPEVTGAARAVAVANGTASPDVCLKQAGVEAGDSRDDLPVAEAPADSLINLPGRAALGDA